MKRTRGRFGLFEGAHPHGTRCDAWAVFEATPSPYLLLAADAPAFTVIGVNDAYLRATMTRREDLLGRGLFAVFPDNPDEPAAQGARNLMASLGRVLAARAADRMAVQRYDIRRPEADGGGFVERWWEPLNVPVFGAGGVVERIIHHVEDVTDAVLERRATGTALAENEERLRLIVGGAKDHAIITTDPEGRITDWSPGAEAIFGWTAAEVVGGPAPLFFTPEDRAAGVPEQELVTARDKGCANDERWHLRKDGGRVFMNGSVHPLRDASGALRGFLKIARDETERRQVEDALHKSEAGLRFALEAGRLGSWELDLASGELTTSETCRTNFGRDPGSPFIYGELRDAIHPDDRPRMEAAVAEALATGSDYDIEYRVLRPNGEVRWVQIRARPSYAADGTPLRMAGISLDITGRKAAEAALREGEERFRRTADTAPALFWVTDAENRCTYLSRSWYEFTGQTPETGFGFGWLDAVHPDDRERSGAVFLAAAARREPFRLEYRLRRADGEHRWAIDAGRPHLSERGEYLGYVGSVIDIGERKAAEEALRESEERFRIAADSSPALMWMADDRGEITFANGRYKAFFGVETGAMLGDGWRSIVHPEDVDAFHAAFRAALAAREPFHRTVRVLHPTLGVRCLSCDGNPRHGAAGEFLGYVGVNIDVTDATAAQEALRESEERYRSLFNSIDAGFCTIELKFDGAGRAVDYRMVEVNPAFERQTGLKDAVGKWMSEIAPALERHWFDIYGRVALTGEPVRFEEPAAALGDRWFDVYAFRVGEPEARRVAVLFNDISERRRAADALVRHRAELERLVEERTADLLRAAEERRRAEEALRQGEKLQAVGQLTGGIAHDFNNILQVVSSGAQLLKSPRLTEKRRAAVLDGMVQAAQNAKELTGRLLAVARKQPLKPEAFDLNARLLATAELLRGMLGPRVAIATDLAPGLWPVRIDPAQLEVAVLNLAVNARDAMPPEGGTLTLQTRNARLEASGDRPAGECVCLAVKDTGRGMPPAVLARVFEPFFTTKGHGKGTGLGLAQVHGFAKQSGGDIFVESAPGEGTRVVLHLPRATESEAAAAAQAGRAAEVGQLMERAAGRAVLVVEDNPDVAAFACTMLEGLGYATRRAESAAEALDALAEGGSAVDAVFSDVVMPGGMSGLDLAAALRRRHPRLAVVLATGYSDALAGWRGAMPAEVLSKPYRLEEVAAALERALARSGAAALETAAAE